MPRPETLLPGGRSTGLSSERYGDCEVCEEHVSDVHIMTTDGGVSHVFGHKKCLISEYKARMSKETV